MRVHINRFILCQLNHIVTINIYNVYISVLFIFVCCFECNLFTIRTPARLRCKAVLGIGQLNLIASVNFHRPNATTFSIRSVFYIGDFRTIR